jgi:hypothetical protein
LWFGTIGWEGWRGGDAVWLLGNGSKDVDREIAVVVLETLIDLDDERCEDSGEETGLFEIVERLSTRRKTKVGKYV